MSEEVPTYGKPDTEHRDTPVCPACGRHQQRPDWGMHDGERGHIHCADCGAFMAATMHITVTWTTEAR